MSHAAVYPASHYVVSAEKMEVAIKEIQNEMIQQAAIFEEQGKLLEAQKNKTANRVRY